MNSSVYIFGNLSSGYTQYPDEESTSSIFQKFYTKAKATTQIAIRRDGNLMYYAYIRKLEQGKYIGLCVLLNGAALTKFEGLFSLFENVISNLVTKGYLIKYNDSGNLIANTEHLYMNREEIDLVAESLKGGFDSMQSTAMILPPVNYAISSESVKEFVVEDDAKEILKSSYTNGYTYIYKSKGFNTALMNSYQGVLSKISKENTSLKKENSNLKEENRKIRQQKKQFKNVILLICVVIGCAIGLFFLYGNLNNTQSMLSDANNTITAKNSIIKNKNEFIQNQKNSIDALNAELNTERNKMSDFKDKVGSFMPIIITDIQIANTYSGGDIETDYGNTIYSSSTMYLKPKITYTGIKTGEDIDLNVKFYTPSGMSTGPNSPYGYSYSTSIYVYSGENTKSLTGWGGVSRGHWRSGTYRFEIWYDDVCLKSKTFTVY